MNYSSINLYSEAGAKTNIIIVASKINSSSYNVATPGANS
jgi:hypothetical protein